MEINDVLEKLKQSNKDCIRPMADGRKLGCNIEVNKTLPFDEYMDLARALYDSHGSLPNRLSAFYILVLKYYTNIDVDSMSLEDVMLLVWRTDIIYRLQEILGIAYDDLKTIVLSTDDATIINESDLTSTLQMIHALGELDQTELANALVDRLYGEGKDD